jgi:pimeloyl-ACP methyl ester carboxylesterase
MVTGFVAGGLAGFAMRSRWAMLLAPAAFVAAFELGRSGTSGPTIDGIHLDTTYGIVAFVLGRGFTALVGLLPMLLGVAYGAGLARQLTDGPARPHGLGHTLALRARQALGGLTTVGVVALAVGIALPASTPPVLGADGKPLPGGIATLEIVRLGGKDQWVMIRAASADKPVLLYLAGGPGQSDLAYARVLYEDLTRDFVVVDWDQRGAGKSYAALDPASTWTLDQAVADTVELTNYLRARFNEEKIYLLGESWGTTLGVLAVQRHPELYHAWIGSGQMVSQRETDRRLYRDVLDLAARTGDEDLARKMRAFGEPPYNNVFAQAVVMEQYDHLYKPYTPPAAYIERGTAAGLGPWGIFGSEYSLVEKTNLLRGAMDMFSVMYPQLQGIDFRRDVTRLQVPVYILDGQAELTSRRDLALEWYALLDAPIKRLYSFEDAGHSVSFEQYEAFHRIMTETVVPETYPAR